MVKIGTKIVVNYGADIPEEYGVVTDIKNDGFHVYAIIEGDDFTMTAHTITERPVNGSPIGVFTV